MSALSFRRTARRFKPWMYMSTFCASTTSSSLFANYLQDTYEIMDDRADKSSSARGSPNICKVLSDQECRQFFPMKDAIRIQGEAFVAMYSGETQNPPRMVISIPNDENRSATASDDTLFKPCFNSEVLGQKVVSVRPMNESLYNLPSLSGCILLWDRHTGLTKCVMDAQFITGRRTAAGSGLATDLFARSDVKVLTVFGAGVQAEEHVRAVLTVRQAPHTIYIVNRNVDKANTLKQKIMAELHQDKNEIEIVTLSLEEFQRGQYDRYRAVISDADVICTCTASQQPLFDGSLLKKGAHINAVGSYKSSMIELDGNVCRECYILVDSIQAFLAGDLYTSPTFDVHTDDEALSRVWQSNPTRWREIGEYMSNEIGANGLSVKKQKGTPIDDRWQNECTLFKSVGVAAQDLHSAFFIYKQAEQANAGTNVPL